MTGPSVRTTRSDSGAIARRNSSPLVGIVGGMGPLASAELVRTVYSLRPTAFEQSAPRVLLWSDPAVIDRTEAIESGDLTDLVSALERSVGGLLEAGASTVVVACMTAHHAFGSLPVELASRCVSLVDILFEELARVTERHLLLCTRGSVSSGLFSGHRSWPELGSRLVVLDDEDQEALHRQLYLLKLNGDPQRTVDFVLNDLSAKYGTSAFVAACTELHLATRTLVAAGSAEKVPHIDPLHVVAQKIADGVL